MKSTRRCACKKKDGQQCTNRALGSSPFCGIHKTCKHPFFNSQKKQQKMVYKPKERLGAGNFGQVWLLEASDGSRLVMKKSHDGNTQEIERQYQNLERVAKLNSRAFVQPVMMDPQKRWFVMEHLPSMIALDKIFKDKIPMKASARKRLGQSLYEAISLLHNHGIVHHDLKPANLMVDPSTGDMKLIDFGMSCERDACNKPYVSGTLLYFPPELLDRCQKTEKSFSVVKPFTFQEYVDYDNWATGLILLTLTDPQYKNMFLFQLKSWTELRDRYRKKKEMKKKLREANQKIEYFFGITDALESKL